MARILVVEDDQKLNQIICTYLAKNNHQPTGCLNPTEAYQLLFSDRYDCIISDIMMPQQDGFAFAQTIRQQDPAIPILFLTALDDIASKRKGFLSGVDDYMVKPVDMDEMAAYWKGEAVPILPREFNILYKLLSHPKKIFTRSELLDEFWGLTNDTGLRTVDVYITKLRKAFAHCDAFQIVTVHGFGYKAVLKEP